MTQSSRALLAKFFKVHPGFLVDDPDGYHAELTSDLRTTEGQLDVWLLQGSERFASDPEVSEVLIKAAREKDTRRCLSVAGRDSRHARTGGPAARSVASGVGRRREPSAVRRARKGGESDDLVRLLLDLFRSRLLLQLLFVCVRRFALRALASAALSRTRRGHSAAVRWRMVRGTRAGSGRRHAASAARHDSVRSAGGASRRAVFRRSIRRSIAAFLAWFGGTGYLLTRFSPLWVGMGLLLSCRAGWWAEESFFCS